MKNIVIIPARLSSSRLPRKVIIDICGKPMIQHVYEAAKKAKNIDEVYIATDSIEVEEVCKKFTSNIIMTSDKHESGTDRLAEAVESVDALNIINVQGDEPLIDPNLIDELALVLENNDVPMVSAMHRIKTIEELKSSNVVKVIVDKNMNAMYFSRSIIPFYRDEWENLINHNQTIAEFINFYKHIGIYGYKKEFLINYSKMEQTYLEKLEKLEQLRVLENGDKIKMVETEYKSIGVDTIEDLEEIRILKDLNG